MSGQPVRRPTKAELQAAEDNRVELPDLMAPDLRLLLVGINPGQDSGATGSPAVPADLAITGCTALVHDDQEGIGFLEDATIVVRDGVIESVTAGPADGVAEAAERIDARGLVAMPGLINCHTHAPMVTLRGVAE